MAYQQDKEYKPLKNNLKTIENYLYIFFNL